MKWNRITSLKRHQLNGTIHHHHHHLSYKCLGSTQGFSDFPPLHSVDNHLAGLLPTLPPQLLTPFIFCHSTPSCSGSSNTPPTHWKPREMEQLLSINNLSSLIQDDSASSGIEVGSSNSTLLIETNWKNCSGCRHFLCDVWNTRSTGKSFSSSSMTFGVVSCLLESSNVVTRNPDGN